MNILKIKKMIRIKKEVAKNLLSKYSGVVPYINRQKSGLLINGALEMSVEHLDRILQYADIRLYNSLDKSKLITEVVETFKCNENYKSFVETNDVFFWHIMRIKAIYYDIYFIVEPYN